MQRDVTEQIYKGTWPDRPEKPFNEVRNDTSFYSKVAGLWWLASWPRTFQLLRCT